MNRCSSLAILLATSVLIPALLRADQGTGPGSAGPGPAEPTVESPASAPAQHPAARGVTYRASAGVTHQFSTDVDGFTDNPSFSMTRYGASLGVAYPVGEVQVSHALTYEYDNYNFESEPHAVLAVVGAPIPSRFPWDDSNLLSYSLNLGYRVSDEWSVFGGPIVGAVAETGADWGDAMTYGGQIGVRRQVSKDLGVGLGVIATSGIEEGATVFPLILVDWRISDHLKLQNARPQPGLRGTAGAELAYEISPKWTIGGGFAYDRRRFRLDDEGSVPDGVGQNSSWPVYVRASYNINDHWSLGAIGGVLLGGNLRLENKDGDKLADSDYQTAPFVGVSAAYSF